MATQSTDSPLRFSFASRAPAGSGSFDVVNLKGFEGISKSFRFDLILMSRKADVDFDAMLVNPAELNIFAPNSTESTPYFGELSVFEQLQQVGDIVFYRATLVPRLERLGRGRTSDVYLGDQTIPQVLDVVLEAGSLMSKDFAINTRRTYRNRDLVCQFQESFLDFFNRWTEKEGMHYFFEHDASVGFEKLQVIDSKSQIPATAVAVKYLQVDSVAGANQTNLVQGFVRRQKPLPKQVVLQGFNYSKAGVPLEVTYVIPATGKGDVMLYGENFLDEKEGKSYAEIRAEEIICRALVFAGESTALGLRSGYFLDLSGHYRGDVNGKYLVTEIHHTGSQAGLLLAGISSPYSDSSGETWYRNTFTALQEAVQFRPERITPRPHIGGTMTATVDSEGTGDLAELGDKGRYKIRMPFTKSGKDPMKASALVRMATPYSGSDHGMNFPLHKGAEVVLSFTDGDPDQPLILSAVPNSENVSLVNNKNPAQSRIRTKGGNEIVMDDTKDKAYIKLSSPYKNTQQVIGYLEPKSSAYFEGSPAVWTGTAGSSESVTVGVSNALKLGFNNSLNLSFDNSFSASMANKMTIGASTSFGVGHDISWTKGKNIKIDDAESVVLEENGKLLANNKITIGGGQLKLITDAINTAKASVQSALLISMAVNGAVAVAAGVALTSAQKDGEKGKVDLKDHSAGQWAARGLGLLGGVVSAIRVHTLLNSTAKAVALAAPDEVYRSKIDVDANGVDISATDALLTSTGRVKTESKGVKLSAMSPVVPLGSDVNINPDNIRLVARNLVARQTIFILEALSAKLVTGAGGTIDLTHGIGGSVKLSDTGVVAKSDTAQLDLTPTGAVLKFTQASAVRVTAEKVRAACGLSSLELTPGKASLRGPGVAGIDVSPMATTIAGALIKLG